MTTSSSVCALTNSSNSAGPMDLWSERWMNPSSLALPISALTLKTAMRSWILCYPPAPKMLDKRRRTSYVACELKGTLSCVPGPKSLIVTFRSTT